jgi:hypothetical protein
MFSADGRKMIVFKKNPRLDYRGYNPESLSG